MKESQIPAKGILKKSNSNPQLTKIEQVQIYPIMKVFFIKCQLSFHSKETKKEVSQLARQLEQQIRGPANSGKIVDIKKYLAQTKDNPKIINQHVNVKKPLKTKI